MVPRNSERQRAHPGALQQQKKPSNCKACHGYQVLSISDNHRVWHRLHTEHWIRSMHNHNPHGLSHNGSPLQTCTSFPCSYVAILGNTFIRDHASIARMRKSKWGEQGLADTSNIMVLPAV
eukprot:1419807-Amphidinium_carterae.1